MSDDVVARWEPLLSEDCAALASPWFLALDNLAVANSQLTSKDPEFVQSGRLYLHSVEKIIRDKVEPGALQSELLTPIGLAYKAVDDGEYAAAAEALGDASHVLYYLLTDVILKCECPKWQKKQKQ